MSDGIQVVLDFLEMQTAVVIGGTRRLNAIKRGRSEPYGQMDDGRNMWSQEIEGVAAEIATAKVLGVFWMGNGLTPDTDRGDVAGFQVRCNMRQDGDLLIRPGDRDDDLYILVQGMMPNMTVRGYKRAGDCKREDFMAAPNGRPPCYFCPPGDLDPIDDLVGLMFIK